MAFTVSLPSGPTLCFKMNLAVRHSPPDNSSGLTSGITMSATSDETTFPVAAPRMKPTARARTEFFRRNSRKPFNITTPPGARRIVLQSGLRGEINYDGTQGCFRDLRLARIEPGIQGQCPFQVFSSFGLVAERVGDHTSVIIEARLRSSELQRLPSGLRCLRKFAFLKQ